MGYYRPTFFFPVTPADAVREVLSWHDAEHLLERYYGEDGADVWTTYSQNGWHQLTLANLANGLQIDGLEFVASEVRPRRNFGPEFKVAEVACLNPAEIERAFDSLGLLTATLPEVIFDPRVKVDPDINRLRAAGSESSFRTSVPARVVDLPPLTVDNPDAWTFASFLKSLREALRVAKQDANHFLYFCPPP